MPLSGFCTIDSKPRVTAAVLSPIDSVSWRKEAHDLAEVLEPFLQINEMIQKSCFALDFARDCWWYMYLRATYDEVAYGAAKGSFSGQRSLRQIKELLASSGDVCKVRLVREDSL